MPPHLVKDQTVSKRRVPKRSMLAILAIAAMSLAVMPAASAATTTAWAPLTGAAGNYTSTMTLAGQPALTEISVTPPDNQGPGSTNGDSGPLAVTGADSTPFIVGGLIVLVVGGLLLVIGRLRRNRD